MEAKKECRKEESRRIFLFQLRPARKSLSLSKMPLSTGRHAPLLRSEGRVSSSAELVAEGKREGEREGEGQEEREEMAEARLEDALVLS